MGAKGEKVITFNDIVAEVFVAVKNELKPDTRDELHDTIVEWTERYPRSYDGMAPGPRRLLDAILAACER